MIRSLSASTMSGIDELANQTNQTYHCDWGSTVTALSVNANGSAAILAARRKIFVVDLSNPSAAPRTLSHQSRWDVGVIHCCPHKVWPIIPPAPVLTATVRRPVR